MFCHCIALSNYMVLLSKLLILEKKKLKMYFVKLRAEQSFPYECVKSVMSVYTQHCRFNCRSISSEKATCLCAWVVVSTNALLFKHVGERKREVEGGGGQLAWCPLALCPHLRLLWSSVSRPGLPARRDFPRITSADTNTYTHTHTST